MESESTWTFDTASPGELAQEANGQVVRNHLYDALGRLSRADTTLDGKTYTDEWTFDEVGRPFQHFFTPADQPRTGEQNEYTLHGYLRQVRSAFPLSNGDAAIYRQIERMNARGQVIEESGAIASTFTREPEYYEHTGRVKRLRMHSSVGGVQQDVLYQYDLVGNVMSREQKDRNLGIKESFQYDALQRLTGSSVLVGGTTVYARSQSYYDDGNLKYKNDAGTYVYGTKPASCSGNATPGPHAVSDVGSAWRCYDANGNMIRQSNKSNGQQVLGITYNAADQAVDLAHSGNADGAAPRPPDLINDFARPAIV